MLVVPRWLGQLQKIIHDVTVITSSGQYNELIDEIEKNKGSTSFQFREKMSLEAFSETAYYDAVISNYFNKVKKNNFPKKKTIYGNLIEKLRYGENPSSTSCRLFKKFKVWILNNFMENKLSYNNYNDIFSALTISKSLPKNLGTVIVKHANPCGVSINKNILKSYKLALACDPVSGFRWGSFMQLQNK